MSAARAEARRLERAFNRATVRFGHWTPFVMKRPWRGDTPLLDPRHVWDTTALTEAGKDTRVMFSLDVGYHRSGWFANSDFEQCLHLSISHPVLIKGEIDRIEDPTDEEVRAWGRAAFGENRHLALVEPPASPLSIDVQVERRSPHVAHIRLWLDRDGNPIKPRGEVYHLRPWDDGTSPEKILRR